MSQSSSHFNQTKFRLWRRRRVESTPQLTIQRKTPWQIRLGSLTVAALFGAAAMWAYDIRHDVVVGQQDNPRVQLREYKEQLETLTAERDKFSSTVNAAESQLTIERTAKKQLAGQVKLLELENTRLKEDLAFFDSLLPNATGPQGVAIRRLKVDQIAPNQLRYRMLIMQGGAGDRVFAGDLQFAVSTLQDGKIGTVTFPSQSNVEQQIYKLSFKHYQRVEGVLTLPEGVLAKQVQARVLERGLIRTQLSVNM